MINDQVKDNQEKGRYELALEGQIVFANYRADGKKIEILHVETPPSLRSKGAAGKLMAGIMEIARAENLQIIPICPYAVTWIERHNI